MTGNSFVTGQIISVSGQECFMMRRLQTPTISRNSGLSGIALKFQLKIEYTACLK